MGPKRKVRPDNNKEKKHKNVWTWRAGWVEMGGEEIVSLKNKKRGTSRKRRKKKNKTERGKGKSPPGKNRGGEPSERGREKTFP